MSPTCALALTFPLLFPSAHHLPQGRIAGETVPLLKEILGTFNADPPDLLVAGPYKDRIHSFTNVRSLTAHNVTLQHRTLVEEHADRALTAGKPLREYSQRFFPKGGAAAGGEIDWADARIRPFEAAERHANVQWLAASADLFLLRTMLQVYERRREVRVISCLRRAPLTGGSRLASLPCRIARSSG